MSGPPRSPEAAHIFIQGRLRVRKLKDGDACTVVAGTHKGKSGIVTDVNTSKTGHVTITVVQKDGVRFKTLAKNAQVSSDID